MNQNWIVENLNNAFSTWNGKLTELWGLVTTSPQTFKGGAVWGVMQSLHNALIGMRVMANCYMDSSAATWVYFDEIHVLLKDSMSADFLNSTWKRFRKYNAYATGITQDIQDYLANPIANALLSNSEYDYHTLVKVAEMAGLAGFVGFHESEDGYIVSFPDTENTQALINDYKARLRDLENNIWQY